MFIIKKLFTSKKKKLENQIKNQTNTKDTTTINHADIVELETSNVIPSSHDINSPSEPKSTTETIPTIDQQVIKKTPAEQVDNVLKSIGILFEPFKDILIKTLPFTKKPIYILDQFGKFVGLITKFLVLNSLKIITFAKTRFFKLIIIFLILMFALGVFLSRSLSSDYYLRKIESSIYEATGYKTEINGLIKIHLVPSLAISIKNIGFYDENYKSNNNFHIAQINTENLYLKIKILPLFMGKIIIKEITLYNFVLNIKPNSSTNDVETQILKSEYLNIMNTINNELNNKTTQINTNNSTQTENNNITIKNDNSYNNSQVDMMKKMGLEYIITFLANNITFDVKALSHLSFNRGKINFLNINNQRSLSLENVNANLDGKISGDTNITGSFRFNTLNTIYELKLKNDKQNTNFDLKINFNTTQDPLLIDGKIDRGTNTIFGNVKANNAIIPLINNFIVNIDDNALPKPSFSGSFIINKNKFSLENGILSFDSNTIKSNIVWDYNVGNYIKINIDTQKANLNTLWNYYTIKDNNGYGNNFDSIVTSLYTWKNNTINTYKPDYYEVSINIEDAIINNSNIHKMQLNFFINSNNDLYINKALLDNKLFKIDGIGLIGLEDKKINFNIQSAGELSSTMEMMGFNDISQNFINIISGTQAYNLYAKLNIDPIKNQVQFYDIQGNMGDKKIRNAYIMIKQIAQQTESTINLNFDNFNISEFFNLYNGQIKKQFQSKGSSANLFGISNNNIVKIQLNNQSLIYNDIKLINNKIELELKTNGLTIKSFEGFGEKYGSLNLAMYVDLSLKPMVIGTIGFDNFYLDLNQLKSFAFTKETIIGNAIINGKLKFSSDNILNIFNNMEGEIDLIKEERIKYNKFDDSNLLYFTLSKKNLPNEIRYFVNDVSGKLKIKNSIISFDPVSILYMDNNNEYRGILSGEYNLSTTQIAASGKVDNTQDVGAQLKFQMQGDITNPTTKINKISIPKENLQKAPNTQTQADINNAGGYANSNNDSLTSKYQKSDERIKTKEEELYEKMLQENLN